MLNTYTQNSNSEETPCKALSEIEKITQVLKVSNNKKKSILLLVTSNLKLLLRFGWIFGSAST